MYKKARKKQPKLYGNAKEQKKTTKGKSLNSLPWDNGIMALCIHTFPAWIMANKIKSNYLFHITPQCAGFVNSNSTSNPICFLFRFNKIQFGREAVFFFFQFMPDKRGHCVCNSKWCCARVRIFQSLFDFFYAFGRKCFLSILRWICGHCNVRVSSP